LAADPRLDVRNLIEQCIDQTEERRRMETVIDAVVARIKTDPALTDAIIEEYVRNQYRSREYGL